MKKYNEIMDLISALEKECGFSKKAIEIRDEIHDKFTRNFGEPVEDFEYEMGIDLATFNRLVDHKNNGGKIETFFGEAGLTTPVEKWEIDVSIHAIVAVIEIKNTRIHYGKQIPFSDYQKGWWFIELESMPQNLCGYYVPQEDLKIQKEYLLSDGRSYYLDVCDYGWVISISGSHETISSGAKNKYGVEENFKDALAYIKRTCFNAKLSFKEVELKQVLAPTNEDLLDTTIECAIGHFTDNGKIEDVEDFEEYLKAKIKEILI